jgi:hypothetical protein
MNGIDKNIYLQYDPNTIDTIRIALQATYNECHRYFRYYRAFYRGSLVAEQTNSSEGLGFTLNH